MPISPQPFAEKKCIQVNGRRMACIDEGEGDAIAFQHGNPTSSYLWRNVMPHCRGLGRLIACDLIGMGDSDKLAPSGPERYTFAEQREYLHALYAALGLGDKVVLVLHDWGSALGFDWANAHRERVQGVAYMEGIVMPVTWADWPDNARKVFQNFRSPAGEEMVLQKNIFVERVLPGSVMRGLTDEEMAVYRKPFATPGEDRRPTLSWPRQIPIDGEPADVVRVVEDYAAWLSQSALPKLFVNADPGSILTGRARVLPQLAEPDRGDGEGNPLHPGRQPGRDRCCGRRLRAPAARCGGVMRPSRCAEAGATGHAMAVTNARVAR